MVSKGAVSKLHQHILIFVDDKLVNLPECEGIVLLNIQSWGAGADPWGTSSDPVRLCNNGTSQIFGLRSQLSKMKEKAQKVASNFIITVELSACFIWRWTVGGGWNHRSCADGEQTCKIHAKFYTTQIIILS